MTARTGPAYLWLGLCCAVLASLPALAIRGLYADDWTVYDIYWHEGAGGVAKLMLDAGHAGFSVPMVLFTWLGGDQPNMAARVIALLLHLLNSFLLLRILRRSKWTAPVAELVTAFFLVTPFYAIRMTLNAVYDFFLVFYLLSYELAAMRRRGWRLLAPICLLFSLSLETLAALEPLRILVNYRRGDRVRDVVARVWPFWIVVIVVFTLRLTVFGKGGHYTGQYAFLFDVGMFVDRLWRHIGSFDTALQLSFQFAVAMVGPTLFGVMIGTAAATAIWHKRVGALPWLLSLPARRIKTFLLLGCGAAILVAGALPYALAGVHADPMRGESRLAFPSQFGALVLLAIAVQCVPWRPARISVAIFALVTFALSTAHDSKWLAYDGVITSDIQRKTSAALLSGETPRLIELRIEPTSTRVFFRQRCLGANDLNVAQHILRPASAPQSFVYEPNCGDLTNPDIVPKGRCPINYLDGYPCPTQRETWHYRLPREIESVDKVSLWWVVKRSLDNAPSPAEGPGTLLDQVNKEVPLPSTIGDDLPPCTKPGVHGALWLLGYSRGVCR